MFFCISLCFTVQTERDEAASMSLTIFSSGGEDQGEEHL